MLMSFNSYRHSWQAKRTSSIGGHNPRHTGESRYPLFEEMLNQVQHDGKVRNDDTNSQLSILHCQLVVNNFPPNCLEVMKLIAIFTQHTAHSTQHTAHNAYY
jgi:hypothetical protein